MQYLSLCKRVAMLLVFAALAGCAMQPKHEDTDWAATPPAEPPPPTQTDGAIYHDMQNMELFADARAHRMGDILTINLVEST